jgi:hypothetical protein
MRSDRGYEKECRKPDRLNALYGRTYGVSPCQKIQEFQRGAVRDDRPYKAATFFIRKSSPEKLIEGGALPETTE